MSHDDFSFLVPYGWSERVLALWQDIDRPDLGPARVVRVERGSCAVVAHDGQEHVVATGEPVAVGDWVATDGTAVQGVATRWSAIARRDPSGTGTQTLAANVDVVIVAAPADRMSAARVERELVVAWDGGARPVVVVTKADLDVGGVLVEDLRSRLVGTDVIATCAYDGDGLAAVRAFLQPCRTAVIIGPSGAGKSTLVNALLGGDVQSTGDVRAGDNRGRHTTTSRQLLVVPSGGVVIDTPGLRSLGLAGAADLGEVFPDIDELAAQCRFRDCAHDAEPGCAVTAAVQSGALSAARLVSYRKLAREADREAQGDDPIAHTRALGVWKARTKDGRRHPKRRPD